MKPFIYTLSLLLLLSNFSFSQNTKKPCPCCSHEHRQFDFWLGEWEVFKNDTLVGFNNIVLLQDSCIIQENWKSVKGKYTGSSYNFFDKEMKMWRQLWIDNQGDNLWLQGEYEDNKMIMYSEMSEESTSKSLNRITWTKNEDETVRQQWEISKGDGGKWINIFDGLYKQKK